MSDIDFDELDRAVNGVLGAKNAPAVMPNTASIQETSAEPVVETTSEVPTITRVERTQLSPTTPSATPAPAASSAPAARRSSGRFMDMVHPSSDMRSRTSDSPVVSKPVTPVQTETAPAASDYNESPAWNEPLESPFLPDAKVEKRPLGGGEVAATTESSSIVDSFDFQGLLDEPEEPLLEAPEQQERIEAHTMPDPIDFAAAKAISDEVESKSYEAEADPIKEEVSVQATPEVIAPQPVIAAVQPIIEEPVGPTSITPQYKEQASSNQESGAMYDTESYHQPVAAPPKKKSGWLTVVLIILLVILGAGGGFAVYTYVLPML
jgi:hypothetical protein